MGQKINPTGFRMGITKNWASRWFADKATYGTLALEDRKIRNLLKERFETAGVKEVIIERSLNDIKITIRVSKPGVVIGRGGEGVTKVQEELKKLTSSKISLTAEEVKVPEIEAALVGQYISRQLKRRLPYRRLVTTATQSAMDKGAKGIKIRVAGLLSGGNSISRTETISLGSIPSQTLRADIDYAQEDCHMIFGTIGIKVWIYKGETEIN
ncbi:30S ribosomal protein S3 [candidate division WWE3 bacterium]|nr:30S ribosomal protein S3 [candidate division WWE3 bacterium]